MTYGKVIGLLRNNWRGRMVTVYEHADPDKVHTVGVPFGDEDEANAIVCDEPKRDYLRVIDLFPETAVYD